MRRAALIAGLAALTLLGVAAPASAHNVLISSDPAEGDRLATAPRQVTLTFDQEVQDAGTNEVAVTGPEGGRWAEGPVRVDRNVVTAPLRPLGPAGEYVIGFRILSADGHSVSDEIRFTLTEAGQGTPASTSPAAGGQGGDQAGQGDQANQGTDQEAAESSTGVPVWVWILGAVVLLAIGLTVALRMGSSPGKRS
ncbi:copper resistance CopC family protein [Prauserella shujinwangii]|uniref:copper resistance CopC family protein n=1 Tax=Prauserella shujinwangii TaxID=1453103 RepID=UPI000D05C248|nr:copper resistance CopC family protein [Prauserella shujinwangii]